MSKLRQLLSNYLISSAILSSHPNRSLDLSPHTMSSMSSTSCADTDFSIAYVTAPNGDVAKDIAKKAVTAGLSACVNIIPSITSVYEWKGNIETDSEVMLIIKTRTDRISELTALVKANHPYEVFELISVPIQNGNPDYIKWLSEVMHKK